MAEEDKPTQTGSQTDTSSEQRTQDQARAAKPSSLTADAEKDAQVEAAKARVAAIKDAAQAAPKAPVKKKEEGPKPTDASAHPLVVKLREKFAAAVIEATEFLGQLSIRIEPARVVEMCEVLKRDPATPFNYLSDLTCAHYPDHREAPFEVIYNLYSISANERVRLKAWVNTEEAGGIDSVTGVWPSADWPEREVYDLFGVNFRNHPDLRRILLPPDWEGHPLRKDYPVEGYR
jgi:NADH-quinone oxidoreductase subunit C